jgi:hypothetical protein
MYALLEKLQAFFPPNIPFLTMLATHYPLWRSMRFVQSWLLTPPHPFTSTLYVQQINGSDDYEALRPLLAKDVMEREDIDKTIVFTNTVNGTQTTCKKVHAFFPKTLRRYVDYLHAHHTLQAK